MLNFNHRGFLIPNNPIKSDVEELRSYFAEQIDTDRRAFLYNNYNSYSNELKNLVDNVPMLQWIDGSFVTKKKEPGDFDMVTFLDAAIIEKYGDKLSSFKFPGSYEHYGVDAYIVSVYNRDHIKYPLYVADRIYWLDAFDKTQRTRTGLRHPKGFLEINF